MYHIFCLCYKYSNTSVSGTYTPAPGGPFSALTPSMWPQDILAKYHQVRIWLYMFLCANLHQHLICFDDIKLRMKRIWKFWKETSSSYKTCLLWIAKQQKIGWKARTHHHSMMENIVFFWNCHICSIVLKLLCCFSRVFHNHLLSTRCGVTNACHLFVSTERLIRTAWTPVWWVWLQSGHWR